MLRTIVASAALLFPVITSAQDMFAITVEDSFDDMTFAVENAIVGRGLKVDTINHVGEMLNRTAADVGADENTFTQAQVFNFCSATLSRDAMAANPANIRYCPYGVFVYTTTENPDQTVIGHQIYPDSALDAVNALLSEIVTEAAEF